MSEVFEDSQIVMKHATAKSTIRLGDVIEVIRGASPRPKGDPKYFGGDIPWISISDITREPGKFLSRTREFVTVAGAEKSRLLPAGTLILSNSGTVCVPKILAVDGCIHDGFVAFPNLSVAFDKTYLYWFFEYIRPSIIEANRQGITQVNLNTGIVREIRLPGDALERQHAIVAEIEKQFSRLDEAVANLQRVKANLKRYKASVLKDAVEGRLVETEAELARREGRSFETGEQLLRRVLEARRSSWKGKGRYKEPSCISAVHLAFVPKGWAAATVGQLCDCIVPSRDKPKSFSGTTPWLTLPDFDEDEIIISSSRVGLGLSYSEIAESKAKVVPKDSVVMSCVGRFGITAVLGKDAVINQQLHAFLPNKMVIPKYLAYALRTRAKEMTAASTATTIAYLNKENCNNIQIACPPLLEQIRIVAEVERRLSLVRSVEAEVDTNLKRAQALRQATLVKAFSIHS